MWKWKIFWLLFLHAKISEGQLRSDTGSGQDYLKRTESDSWYTGSSEFKRNGIFKIPFAADSCSHMCTLEQNVSTHFKFHSTKKRPSRASALRTEGVLVTNHLVFTITYSPNPWTRP